MARKYLVTGGAGFIGSNFIRHLCAAEPDSEVVNLDLLTYAGVAGTVAELDELPGHTFVHGDIRDEGLVQRLVADVEVVVNFAAESHVDRSIEGPFAFLDTNVNGVGVLLEAARATGVPTFLQVSTDEVYGSIESGAASEDAPLNPSSPYSASKAAADLLVGAYRTTYGYGAIISRSVNNYGPYQFPEKVIPRFLTNLADGLPVPVYGDGLQMREWLHVDDHCAALRLLVEQGTPGEIYNVGSGEHVTNLDLARRLVVLMGRDDSLIEHVTDRPGHDRRYAVDSSRLRALGWSPRRSLDEGLADTATWYRTRQDWWRNIGATA